MAWTSLGHASITEVFARSGVDCVAIDIEHSTISQEQSQRIIAACQGVGPVCLPRIASHNMEMIKRLLDSGADGIIVPMVSTPQETEQIISWCKYPPLGKRSFGVARGQAYGLDFDEYVRDWNEVSSIIVQIESNHGIENIDGILSFEELDGVMIGPYDLSGSLGVPGQLDHPKVIDAVNEVINKCKKYNKACGIHLVEADSTTVENAFSAGHTFVVLSSDVFILWKWAARMQELIKCSAGL